MTSSAIAHVPVAPPTMPATVVSQVLGALQVAPEQVLLFPEGLLGFPACREFVLVPAGRDGLFWLQSLEHGALTFLLADPFRFVPGYAVELPPDESPTPASEDARDVMVLAILTLPQSRSELPTANLQGPVVLDLRHRRGRQVVLPDAAHSLRQPVDIAGDGA